VIASCLVDVQPPRAILGQQLAMVFVSQSFAQIGLGFDPMA
jgi:hypothetical protein